MKSQYVNETDDRETSSSSVELQTLECMDQIESMLQQRGGKNGQSETLERLHEQVAVVKSAIQEAPPKDQSQHNAVSLGVILGIAQNILSALSEKEQDQNTMTSLPNLVEELSKMAKVLITGAQSHDIKAVGNKATGGLQINAPLVRQARGQGFISRAINNTADQTIQVNAFTEGNLEDLWKFSSSR